MFIPVNTVVQAQLKRVLNFMKKCTYCERTDKNHRLINFQDKILVCWKHARQLYNKKKISNRNKYDKNEIFNRGDYFEAALYDIKCNIKAYFKFSKQDLKLVKSHKWWMNNFRYILADIGKGKRIFFHRTVLQCPEDLTVDHINGDTLNCQRNNLRFATLSQNSANMHKLSYKGVYFDSRNKHRTYQAKIKYNYKSYFLGTFLTPELAALAYNHAAKKYFGEFACLNIIP